MSEHALGHTVVYPTSPRFVRLTILRRPLISASTSSSEGRNFAAALSECGLDQYALPGGLAARPR